MRYDDLMEIQGKTALVTGAARRVGRVIALELARYGADIVLHYRESKEDALKTQADISALGVRCHLKQADLSRTDSILEMTQSLENEKIRVDALVNSASLFYKTPLETASEADWNKFIDANLKACFTLSRVLGLRMKNDLSRLSDGKQGKIVNIADWSGFRPYRDYTPYCTSKGGLISLTKALARDLAPSVCVNAVAPGPVMKPEGMSEEEHSKTAAKTALGRWGTPEDVAHAVRFLIESDYMNGTVLVVDGGRSIV